jgi:aryl-alcohol dehydrogenase-like predicted oxidoreductase
VSLAAAAGTFSIGGELTVNRMGFGAMRVTGPGVWGPPRDRDEAIRVLRRAVELGVNLIDTAEAYGPHTSEELIAEALWPYPDGLVVATKGGYDRPGPGRWDENGRPERLRAECEGSLRRLRVERIDLWQLHRIDPAVPAEDQFATIRDLQVEGKVRLVGLSEVGVEQLDLARSALDVASVQNQYNLLDRRWDGVLEVCHRDGIAFLPWYPLAVGRLATADGAVADVARRHDATPAQVALAWLLRRSPVVLPIPGTSTVAHLDENTAAAELRLSPEDAAALDAVAG